jgi:hypothetical protein
MKKISLFIPLFLLLLSCGEDEAPAESATLRLNFSHVVKGEALALNTGRYVNAAGETYNIQKFKYYISNLRLRNTRSGEVYNEPDSYHLVNTADGPDFNITISDLPDGEFNQLEFGIGVDNASNTSTDRFGDLDPSNDMAWDWNTGYKFILLEGLYFPEQGDSQPLVYHVGEDMNYRTLTFNLEQAPGSTISLSPGQLRQLNLTVDIAQIFENPHTVSFVDYPVVMFNPFSQQVADNFASGLFTITSIE